MRTGKITVKELTQILEQDGKITPEQAQEILVKADAQKARLQIALSKNDFNSRKIKDNITAVEVIAACDIMSTSGGKPLDEYSILQVLSKHVGMPYEKIDTLKLDSNLVTSTLSLPFARRTCVLPLRKNGNTLTIAVSEPYNEALFEELRIITKLELNFVLTEKTDIQRIITEIYGFKRSVANAAKEMKNQVDIGNLEQLFFLNKIDEIESNDQHIVNAVDYLLHYALDQRASDIHIEPKRNHSQVRMRIDGILHDIHRVPKQIHQSVVTRIKTMSRLDLAEKRRPQDGRFKTNKDSLEVEMRVSTLPVAFGEKVVIRIFDPSALIQDTASLGFCNKSYEKFMSFIERPNGLILVTGPTGSGKTTTLYSALKYLSNSQVNIVSIEDPIEMVVEEFNQIAVHKRIDLTFANALRHVLRQDPDIVMVGEIRDTETAKQAIAAALTGHLVLSTLHTNDTATSITRLLELEVNPYLVASTLVGVVAQRLVRCVCKFCKTETTLLPDQLSVLGIDLDSLEKNELRVWEGEGCIHCRNTGLWGRTSLFELLEVNDTIREHILNNDDATEILRAARADGTITLREAAIQKLAQGITSFDEVIRTTIDADR